MAIASNTRLEWIFADLAIMLSGAATTTVYPSTQPEDVDFILGDSGTQFLIAEDQGQADKVGPRTLPRLSYVVLIDGEGDGDKVLSWAQLTRAGPGPAGGEPQPDPASASTRPVRTTWPP